MIPEQTVELYVNSAWQDITSDVREGVPIAINYGRADEGARSDPSKCSLALNNRDGKYSPRNPLGPFYGSLGRNSPLRVRVSPSRAGLILYGVNLSRAWAEHHASFNITGDFDFRMDIEPDSWRPAQFQVLASRHRTPALCSWILHLMQGGNLEFSWTPSGAIDGTRKVVTSAALPADTGRIAVRVTLTAATGTVRFYTSDSVDGVWTQLGADTVVGATSLHAADTVPLTVGAIDNGWVAFVGSTSYKGTIYDVQLRSGIAGTIVVDADFDNAARDTPEAATFVDNVGRTWQVWTAVASLTDFGIRFSGEVSNWPSRWDISDTDVYVPIEAAGIFRRLGQGTPLVRSALRTGLMDANRQAPALAYWPLEDGKQAATLAAATPDTKPMDIHGFNSWTGQPSGAAAPQIAAFDGFISSLPVPKPRLGRFIGQVPSSEYTGVMRASAMFFIQETGAPSSSSRLLTFYNSGTAEEWTVIINSGGDLGLIVWDTGEENVLLNSPGSINSNLNGFAFNLSLKLTQSGANVAYEITYQIVGSGALYTTAGTVNSTDIGIPTKVMIGDYTDDLGSDSAAGHVQVQNYATYDEEVKQAVSAFHGERGGYRVARLATAFGLPVFLHGDYTKTPTMGYQLPGTLLSSLDAVSAADMGILGEQRSQLGLSYRCRHSLYSQTPALELDYAQGLISAPFEPQDDDQNIRNDITVGINADTSYKLTLDSGPLSTQEPPNGIGRYEESVELSLSNAGQLPSQAAWRLHMGTVDELAFPSVRLNMANPRMDDYAEAVQALRQGDRLQIINTPDWLPPGAVDLIVQGYTEILNVDAWELVLNCTNAKPWEVGQVKWANIGPTSPVHADTEASQLAAACTSSAGTISVATTKGPAWTTSGTYLPFDILCDGEVMRVTAVGAVSGGAQTFTVTRSINGVIKAHAIAESVALAYPAIVAL